MTLAFCWAHVRRRFYELAAAGAAPIASEALRRIAELYRIEDDIRGRSADERRAMRQENSRAIVADLEPWLREKLGLISQKTKLAEAIRYTLSRWEGLTRFLDDGRVEIDSNTVERSIRPIAIPGSFCPCWAGGRSPLSLASVFRTPASLREQRRTRERSNHSSRRRARACHYRSGLDGRSRGLRDNGPGLPARIACRAA